MTSPRRLDNRLRALAAAAVVAAGGPAAHAAATADEALITSGPIANLRDDDLLLFAVDLDGLTLTDSMAAYGDPNDPLLPMGELVRLLDLNVTVSPGDRRITGSVGQAQRPITVDLVSGAVRAGGRDLTISGQDVAVTPGEIYVRASVVAKLLPLKIAADPEALTLKLTALEKMPIQSRLERLARLRDLRPDVGSADDALHIPNPYRMFSPPAVDVSISTARDTRPPTDPRRYDIRMAGDLAHMGFQGYIGSDDNGQPNTARVLLERHALNGGLLGPLNATSFTIGDTFTPALAIGPRSVGGRGFAFTTAPLAQQSVFNRIDLRGELPLGYDVELYVNDVLRSGQRTPVEGRYEFLGVPLVRGINVIRIVMYGPRGEREEQTRVITVGGGQLKPGQTTFDFGVVQQDRTVVTFDNTSAPAPTDSGWRVVANAARGISDDLTVLAGAAYYPIDDQSRRALLMLGARTSWRGFSIQADVAGDDRKGRAVALGAAGQPWGISIVARHAEYSGGFVDETNPAMQVGRPLNRHSEITIDTNIHPGGRSIPLSMRGQGDQYSDGSAALFAAARASTVLGSVLVSGGLDYRRDTSPDLPAQERLTGVLAASTFAAYKWQLRGALDYELLPEARASALTLTADRALTEHTALRFGLGRTFGDEPTTSFQAGAIFRLARADLAISGDYSMPDDNWRIGLQLAFGLAFDPLEDHYTMTRPGPASGGSVAFQAFVDRNSDGVYQPGEPPVGGVVVSGGERPTTTTLNGQAFVTGVGSAPVTRVQVALDEVDNPYLQSPPHSIEFEPRAGKVLLIPYPLTPTGEVMVRMMYRQDDGKLVGLSAVQLTLTRETGGEPVTGSTEFDGSVDFESLPAGTYRLDLDPDQARRLHMRLKKPVTFTVSPDGGYLADIKAEVVFDRSTDQ